MFKHGVHKNIYVNKWLNKSNLFVNNRFFQSKFASFTAKILKE